jgi:hypothetical protein
MGLTYPDNPFQDGEIIPATRWNGRWTSISQKFGNVVNDDIADGADISGAKLAVNTLPGDRIANKTVAQAQIGLQSVGNPEIIDLTIQKGKFSTTTGQKPTMAQLELLTQEVAFSLGQGIHLHEPPTPIPATTYLVVGLYLSGMTTPEEPMWLSLRLSGLNYGSRMVIDQPGTFIGSIVWVYIART